MKIGKELYGNSTVCSAVSEGLPTFFRRLNHEYGYMAELYVFKTLYAKGVSFLDNTLVIGLALCAAPVVSSSDPTFFGVVMQNGFKLNGDLSVRKI